MSYRVSLKARLGGSTGHEDQGERHDYRHDQIELDE
jgi:hypothetical protein